MPEIPYRENPNPDYRAAEGDDLPYLGTGHAIGVDRAPARRRGSGVGFGQDLDAPTDLDLREAIDEAIEALEALACYPGELVHHRPVDVQRGLGAIERLHGVRP